MILIAHEPTCSRVCCSLVVWHLRWSYRVSWRIENHELAPALTATLFLLRHRLYRMRRKDGFLSVSFFWWAGHWVLRNRLKDLCLIRSTRWLTGQDDRGEEGTARPASHIKLLFETLFSKKEWDARGWQGLAVLRQQAQIYFLPPFFPVHSDCQVRLKIPEPSVDGVLRCLCMDVLAEGRIWLGVVDEEDALFLRVIIVKFLSKVVRGPFVSWFLDQLWLRRPFFVEEYSLWQSIAHILALVLAF